MTRRSLRLVRLAHTFKRNLGIACALLIVVIFTIDVALRVHLLLPLVYVAVILVGTMARSPWVPLYLAAEASALTLVDWAWLHVGLNDVAAANVGLVLANFWIVAAGGTLFRITVDRQSAAQRQLRRIREAIDAEALISVTDARGRIEYVNDNFCALFQYSREELIGQDHRLLNSGVHSKAFIDELWTTIRRGEVWHGEIQNRAKDGSLVWVDTRIIPLPDAKGRPAQYMAFRHDVTARVKQEERFRQQASLAALGEFAAVVAHEVRNPLAGIRNGVQVLASELPAAGEGASLAGAIIDRIDALNRVVGDLLTFARPRDLQPVPIPMREFLTELAATLRQDPATMGVDVSINIEPFVTVNADPDQLRLVFHNLLLNAAQAMKGSGLVTVASEPAGDGQCAFFVADRGQGLNPDSAAKVFEPFFTTKHQGTGLGLPIVKRMVEAHHGTVTLTPRIGGGAVACVTLPCAPRTCADGGPEGHALHSTALAH